MIQGESYSIGVLFPDFDISRIIRFKIAIGKTVVGTYPDGNAIQTTDGFRVALTGDETKLLQGGNSNIQIYITDSQLGILKPFVTTLKVENTNISDAGSDVNSGYNFILTVKIKETTVSYSYQFKDLIKGEQGIQGIQGVQGDKGDAGTIEVGTVTTGDAGTDVIVENVGTPSEAILNFTIPRGNSGDFFSGDYNLIIKKQNCTWVDGWLHIDTGAKVSSKRIDVGYMAINTGIGTEQLKPIVHYPAALTYETSSVPNGFYLKDEDGRLSENTDFEFIDVKYNILNDTVAKYDGLTRITGGNVINEHGNSPEEQSHASAMSLIFSQIYTDFAGDVIRTDLDQLANFTLISAAFAPTYCRAKNADLKFTAYATGAIIEELGSNPDILSIAPHYSNTFERRDITPNATTFINNVIAIGSCPDEELPTIGTSYGFGVEFFEDTIKTSSEYPDFNYAVWNPIYQQSATTAIISAKFRMIKDAVPAASWHTIRKAARLTARKTVGGVYAASFPWDMYRGFGIIHVDGAIQYIKDNYTENADYLNQLADDVDRTRGIDPMLPFENISENTPVPKGKMHEVTENNYTDDDKAKVTELSPIFWDEDNNTFSYQLPDGGSIQIGEELFDYYTNVDTVPLTEGMPVSIVAVPGNRKAIRRTDPTSKTSVESFVGIVTVPSIAINQQGRVTKFGNVSQFNTSLWADNDPLYVTSLGVIGNTEPAAGIYKVKVGHVVVSSNNGTIGVNSFVRPKLVELSDVDGATTEVLDGETIPVKKVDGIIKFLSWANIKATLKTYSDTLYASLAGATFTGEISALFGVKTAKIYPKADSTTAVQVTKADKTTAVLSIDTLLQKTTFTATTTEPPIEAVCGAGGRNFRMTGATPYAEFYTQATYVRIGWFGYGLNANDFYFVNDKPNSMFFCTNTFSNVRLAILNSGNVGIGTSTPKSKLQVNGAVQVANDTADASAEKEGAIRYRADANNSYMEMCMQTGAATYEWVVIKTNTW